MDMNLSDADRAFRDEVRAFLEEALTEDIREGARLTPGVRTQTLIARRWAQKLANKGWLCHSWPKEHGGPGWNAVQKFIFESECAAAGTPIINHMGIKMVGPVVMKYGTEEQKAEVLPSILKDEFQWCQGYSEPGSGSDLASLQTRAVRDGDHWVINGTKTWTTKAHWADWCFMLVRTSSEGRKQEGITFVLVDLKTPGIEIRPIYLIDGLHETNMVFFTDVRVPVANTVGEIDKGWSIGKYLLAHERMSGGSLGTHKTLLRQLKQIARDDEVSGGRPLAEDPDFAREIASIEIELRTLEAFNLRALDKMSKGGELGGKALGVEANVFKIRNSEIHQRLTELKMKAIGYYANPYLLSALSHGWNEPPIGAEYANGVTPAYLHFRKVSIYSGSNEIQHNIIAKAELGL